MSGVNTEKKRAKGEDNKKTHTKLINTNEQTKTIERWNWEKGKTLSLSLSLSRPSPPLLFPQTYLNPSSSESMAWACVLHSQATVLSPSANGAPVAATPPPASSGGVLRHNKNDRRQQQQQQQQQKYVKQNKIVQKKHTHT